jgi:hypothetical protein
VPLPTALPYGIRDVKLLQYTTLAADVFGSSLVDLPNARTFQFNDTEEYSELRGDDKLVTSHGQGAQGEWELEGGGISFAAHAILVGGQVVETGITPNQRRRFRKLATDQRPFFVALGQSISDSGGDMHAIMWCCRSTGNAEGTLADTEFLTPTISGTGFPCRVNGNVAGLPILDAVYDFVQNETITALTVPALDTPAAPSVYTLSDQTSPLAGGELVIVTGERFTGVVSVQVGGTNVTDYEVQSQFQIAAILPAKAAGTHHLVVTNGTGASATGTQTAVVYS